MPGTSVYTLGGHDIDLTNMVGIIKAPGGTVEPCLLKKMPDGKLGKNRLIYHLIVREYSLPALFRAIDARNSLVTSACVLDKLVFISQTSKSSSI